MQLLVLLLHIKTCEERVHNEETAFDKGSNCTCAQEAHTCILKLMSNLLNYLFILKQIICQCKAISSWLSIPVSTKSLYICILHPFTTRHTRYPLASAADMLSPPLSVSGRCMSCLNALNAGLLQLSLGTKPTWLDLRYDW